jgi:CubicO group peptidase (beta-lactamase class C family)
MASHQSPIGGYVESGFERVRAVFERNLEERNELGAACAAYHRGEKVVDLWGGYRDVGRTRPWTEDTLVLVFSSTKGVAATAMARAHADGLFAYDDLVADHWPAFGRAGKGDVTVRDLLGHRAGVASIDGELTPSDVADREALVDRLAAKDPDWTPGERQGYHAWSLGWYESELVRRTDPAGRTLATYAAETLFEPLDAEFHVGLPEDISPDRVADIKSFGARDALSTLGSFPVRLGLALAIPWSMSARAMSPFDISTPAELNDPEWRTLEIPAGNGIGRVSALARLYGDLATGGERVGLDRETEAELRRPPTSPPGGSRDVILKTETAYSLGYWKPFDGFRFGSPAAFGAPGAGGSFAFADPESELGFAYAPNRMGTHLRDDPRERALRDAVIECVEARPGGSEMHA